MTHMKLKLAVAAVVLISAVAYLGFAGVRSGWVYYVQVNEFLDNPTYHAQRVRLCGIVADENCDVQPAALTANFTITAAGQSLPVNFKGVVPSAFTTGGEVVVEGKLDDAGVFQANVLLTKCASKYQAEDHAKRLQGES